MLILVYISMIYIYEKSTPTDIFVFDCGGGGGVISWIIP